jgi:hypothetical protein
MSDNPPPTLYTPGTRCGRYGRPVRGWGTDLVGGLGPLEGPGVAVPGLDPVLERGGEFVEGAEI